MTHQQQLRIKALAEAVDCLSMRLKWHKSRGRAFPTNTLGALAYLEELLKREGVTLDADKKVPK